MNGICVDFICFNRQVTAATSAQRDRDAGVKAAAAGSSKSHKSGSGKSSNVSHSGLHVVALTNLTVIVFAHYMTFSDI